MVEREDEFIAPGYRNKEERDEFRELDRLCAESIEATEKIENGIDTSAAQLDRHLTAYAAHIYWSTQHALSWEPWEPASLKFEREDLGIEYLKIQKILNGSYHKEKAAYCAERAQEHIQIAEKHEQELASGDEIPGQELSLSRQSIARSRRWAANWLRTEANCLDMPEARPAAPPPPQAEH